MTTCANSSNGVRSSLTMISGAPARTPSIGMSAAG